MTPHPPDRNAAKHQSERALLIRLGAGITIGVLLLVGLLLLRNPPVTASPERRDALQTLVNLNTATPAELAALPNIGPTLAERIALDRETYGRFDSVDALDRVPGIGVRTIDALRPYATAR